MGGHGRLWGARMGVGNHVLWWDGVDGNAAFLAHDWWGWSSVVENRVR